MENLVHAHVIWMGIELAYAGISTMVIYLFLQAFFKQQNRSHFALNIFVILTVIAIRFLIIYFNNENVIIISTVSIISAFVISMSCFRTKVIWATLASVLSSIAGAISELMAAFMITSLNDIPLGDMMQFNIYRLQGRILSYLFFLLIIVLVKRIGTEFKGSATVKSLFAICVLPLFSIITVQWYTTYIVETVYVLTINEVIPMVSIVIVNIFIFAFVENLTKQNEKEQALIFMEAKNTIQEKHIQQLIQNYEQIRTLSHDFKQERSILYKLCKERKYEELLNALTSSTDHMNTLSLVKTGNIMLDAILTSKKAETVKNSIDFKLKLNLETDASCVTLDICILLGNALDNAIEACMRSPEKNRFVEMELATTETKLLCRIRNTVGEVPQAKGDFLITKKSDKLHHGIGLRSMKQTCERLGGDIAYDYDAEHFRLWLYIPI